jgi:hypothetical protein
MEFYSSKTFTQDDQCYYYIHTYLPTHLLTYLLTYLLQMLWQHIYLPTYRPMYLLTNYNLFTYPPGCNHNERSHKVCHNYLKLYFHIFFKSQKEHNKWNFHFFPFLSSIICKVLFFKTWCKLMMFQKPFCMFKTIIIMVFYFKCVFDLANYEFLKMCLWQKLFMFVLF